MPGEATIPAMRRISGILLVGKRANGETRVLQKLDLLQCLGLA